MNRLFIIGNLTNNPDVRVTQNGDKVCSFGVAVNRRRARAQGQEQTDFFRVSAWRGLAENCEKYLAKGRKVAVTGSVSVNVYTTQNGVTRASMEVIADDVEFLTPKSEAQNENDNPPQAVVQSSQAEQVMKEGGYVEVDDDELPFESRVSLPRQKGRR